ILQESFLINPTTVMPKSWASCNASFIFYVTGGTFILEPAVSNTMVIEVTSSNATLSLQNGPLAIGHVTTLSGVITASLNVLKIV
ncbi:hypothetical protein ACT4UL_11345, partial [Bacillus sp. HC-TM]